VLVPLETGPWGWSVVILQTYANMLFTL